jgi:hypothetical protein
MVMLPISPEELERRERVFERRRQYKEAIESLEKGDLDKAYSLFVDSDHPVQAITLAHYKLTESRETRDDTQYLHWQTRMNFLENVLEDRIKIMNIERSHIMQSGGSYLTNRQDITALTPLQFIQCHLQAYARMANLPIALYQ